MANAVSKTAYYTLGVRVTDAASPRPICGDSYAARFMDEEAQRVWKLFKGFKPSVATNATRHRIIDDLVQEELARRKDARVVVIGSGFDTRAFRLNGGRWLEVDEPAIISVKNERLPAESAKNPLERVAIEFSRESLVTRLAPYKEVERTHVIVEGVLMYLTHAQRRQLLQSLRELFPAHVLYCDLMTRTFLERYSRGVHERLKSLGASFTDMTDKPEALFLEEGYTPRSSTSIVVRAGALGGPSAMIWPVYVACKLLPSAQRGFQVWKFEAPRAGP
jgi:methyltransferase (TIGR00027 family)